MSAYLRWIAGREHEVAGLAGQGAPNFDSVHISKGNSS